MRKISFFFNNIKARLFLPAVSHNAKEVGKLGEMFGEEATLIISFLLSKLFTAQPTSSIAVISFSSFLSSLRSLTARVKLSS